ncbi:ejection protein [Pseudanabaena phage Pan3]|nr:ejection protein [Pseudanabaena phage Pan3]
MQEGATATNPQTGERVVLRGGQWVPMGAPTPTPTAPGVIYGRPRTPDPLAIQANERAERADQRAERSQQFEELRLSNDQLRTQIALSEEQRRAEEAQRGRDAFASRDRNALNRVQRILDTLETIDRDARDGGGWFETGLTGSLLRNVPGTAARDLAGSIQSIDANAAFEELARMRAESPTGGALGAITERELDLLRSTVANLDPNLSQQEFLNQLNIALQHYRGVRDRLRGVTANEQTPTAIMTGAQAMGMPDTVQGQRFTPEQEAAFGEFIRNNAGRLTPEMISQWYQQNGLGPAGAGGQEFVDAVNTGQPYSTAIDYSVIDEARRRELEAEQARRNERTSLENLPGRDAQSSIVAGRVFGLADEAAGLGGALIGALPGGNSPVEGYLLERDLARLATEQRGERMGSVGTALEIGGALLTGRAPTAIGPAARVTPSMLMREGAIGGSIAGFGYGEGPQSVPNALLGAGGGALLGYAGGRVGERLMARGATNRQAQMNRNALLQDAADQGIDLLPADVGGGVARGATAAAGQFPVSAGRMAEAVANSRNSVGEAIERTATAVGNPTNSEMTGNAIRRAGQSIIDRSQAVGRQLYERAERMASGVSVRPATAVQAIDDQIAQLRQAENVNAPLITELQRFREDLARAPYVPVSVMRDLRSAAGKLARSEDLRATPAQRVFGEVMRSLADDIDNGLQAAGRGNAAAAFRRADNLWRDRIEYIDEVLEPIMGRNRSGEQIMGAIDAMTRDRGNASRLRQVIRALDDRELGDLRASIIQRLGTRRADEMQTADDVFSPANFLANWENMSRQSKEALFSGELRRNLDQIANVAAAMRGSSRFTNSSNTGGVVGWLLTGGAFATDLTAFGAGLAGQAALGRLMTSPGFTRWVARAPRNGTLPNGYIRQLGAIASREPHLARELTQVQQALEAGLAQSPSRALAEGQEEQGGR